MPDGARAPETEVTEVSGPAPTAPRRKASPTLAAEGRLRFILEGSPPHPVEFFNALQLIGWGGWLLFAPGAFNVDPLLYSGMAAVAPEGVWGGVMLAGGLFSMIVLLFDGRGGRAGAAMAGFIIWSFLAFLMGQPTGFRSTVVPVYAIRALAAGWVYIRLERDRRRIG